MKIEEIRSRKIIVIGCPGSGKSYFSRMLRDKLGIPLYYMDCLFWRENWEHISREELRETVNKIMEADEWIIDGNYISTLEDRYRKAETIFFMDMPEEVCIESEAKRRGTKREDLPQYLVEEDDPEFVEYIKSFKTEQRPQMLSLIEKYPEKQVFIFRSRDEVVLD